MGGWRGGEREVEEGRKREEGDREQLVLVLLGWVGRKRELAWGWGIWMRLGGLRGWDAEGDEALFEGVPVGIREFMKSEKRLRERESERDREREKMKEKGKLVL